MQTPFDPRCNRKPIEIPEYVDAVRLGDDGLTDSEPTESEVNHYVITNEGTFNPENGHFVCTECYVAIGMPTSRSGWKMS